MWQTDFTPAFVGQALPQDHRLEWMYVSTIFEDFSRYIIAWKQCTTMKARLLSDNGSSYISGDLATWFDHRKMTHFRGAPHHPQTQGKIEPSGA